jgi:hypothetical protein
MDQAAEARRRARAAWKTRIFRPGEEAAAEEANVDFWDEIPLDQRAGVVWELSQEIFALAKGGSSDRGRPSRSVVRIVRR